MRNELKILLILQVLIQFDPCNSNENTKQPLTIKLNHSIKFVRTKCKCQKLI